MKERVKVVFDRKGTAKKTGIRVLLMKFLQKLGKGHFLLMSSRILGRLAVLGTSTDINHADA